jgi:hypothetical protein
MCKFKVEPPLQLHVLYISTMARPVSDSKPHLSSSSVRLYMTGSSPFIPSEQCGQSPSLYPNGLFPIFFGSAHIADGIHPCKIVPHLLHPCRVPYGGVEYNHDGTYTLLPFDPSTMEFVPSSFGEIPSGRRPVEGGYEAHGPKLYHAVAEYNGIRLPGKTGLHLVCSSVVAHERVTI